METIKSCTDIEQSRKLSEFLSHESADMFIADVVTHKEQAHSYNFHILSTWGCNTFEELKDRENKFVNFTPAWSLAALLSVLPTLDDRNANFCKDIRYDRWHVYYHSTATSSIIDTERYDNLVDACYEMIIKLRELNLL